MECGGRERFCGHSKVMQTAPPDWDELRMQLWGRVIRFKSIGGGKNPHDEKEVAGDGAGSSTGDDVGRRYAAGARDQYEL